MIINLGLVDQLGLLVEALSPPRTVEELVEQVICWITHNTLPLSVILAENYCEILSFDSPSIGTRLAYHNPPIDWQADTVAGWSSYCHVHCLLSAVSPHLEACCTNEDKKLIYPTCLWNITICYRYLVSIKQTSPRLYDCPIDLVPGTALPKSCMYNPSRPERDTMDRYILESPVALGFIHLSLSLMRARKKDKTTI